MCTLAGIYYIIRYWGKGNPGNEVYIFLAGLAMSVSLGTKLSAGYVFALNRSGNPIYSIRRLLIKGNVSSRSQLCH